MLSKNILNALNNQIVKEGDAAQIYLAMASWAEKEGYDGIAEWFYAQHLEEIEHMLKIIKYVNERGEHGIVPKIEQPPSDFKSVYSLF